MSEMVNRLQERLKELEVLVEHQAKVIRVYRGKLTLLGVEPQKLIDEDPERENRDPVLHRSLHGPEPVCKDGHV